MLQSGFRDSKYKQEKHDAQFQPVHCKMCQLESRHLNLACE
jgi:hypothetical protein